MDNTVLHTAFNLFSDDKFSDAEDSLVDYFRVKRDSFIQDKLGLENDLVVAERSAESELDLDDGDIKVTDRS